MTGKTAQLGRVGGGDCVVLNLLGGWVGGKPTNPKRGGGRPEIGGWVDGLALVLAGRHVIPSMYTATKEGGGQWGHWTMGVTFWHVMLFI